MEPAGRCVKGDEATAQKKKENRERYITPRCMAEDSERQRAKPHGRAKETNTTQYIMRWMIKQKKQ